MDISVLHNSIENLPIEISDQQTEQFSVYGDLLIEWNERMNLTRIVEPAAVCRQHFLDSIMPICYVTFEEKSLIDIGTGAGFPGLPLKIMNPTLKLTLLDALDKRCRFLQEVVDRLALKEVTILHGRAEDYARDPAYRGRYDYATSRAVAKLNILCEYDIPFLKEGGQFIAYKLDDGGSELNDAANALSVLQAKCERSETYDLPETEPRRAIHFIKSNGTTPEKYPRRAGVPEKKPL